LSHEHIPSEPVRSYLLGTLVESSAASIEEQYLSVPDLRRRLEEVLGQVPASIAMGRLRYARLRLVTATLLVCSCGGRSGSIASASASTRCRYPRALVRSLATISLSPGLLKGPDARPAQLGELSARGNVKLVLDRLVQVLPTAIEGGPHRHRDSTRHVPLARRLRMVVALRSTTISL
jgi:hypothetical protein